MKKLTEKERISVYGGVTYSGQCEGRRKDNAFYYHNTTIYGDGPNADYATADYNIKLQAHKASMRNYYHSGMPY